MNLYFEFDESIEGELKLSFNTNPKIYLHIKPIQNGFVCINQNGVTQEFVNAKTIDETLVALNTIENLQKLFTIDVCKELNIDSTNYEELIDLINDNINELIYE